MFISDYILSNAITHNLNKPETETSTSLHNKGHGHMDIAQCLTTPYITIIILEGEVLAI